MLAFGWGLAAAIGAVAGMMAAPMIYLDPDMMSAAFRKLTIEPMIRAWAPSRAPLHQCVKAILRKHDIAHQSHYGRKQIREYELR